MELGDIIVVFSGHYFVFLTNIYNHYYINKITIFFIIIMDKNFIVYKASGGLAHSLGGLWRAINMARAMNRFLVIDYNKHKAFENSFSKFFHLDINIGYTDNYSVIPEDFNYRGHSVEELKNAGLTSNFNIFGKSPKSFKNSDKIIVVAGTSGKKGWVSINELIVNDDIIERLKSEPEIKGRYIAVHFRNTDIRSNLGRQVSQINQIRKATQINTLYLSSDDCDALSKYKEVLPDMDIIMYSNPPKVEINIHYGSPDKSKQIYEVLRDCYFILKSDFFVPCTTSGLSRMLITMLEKNKNMFRIPTRTIPITGLKNASFDKLLEEYLEENKDILKEMEEERLRKQILKLIEEEKIRKQNIRKKVIFNLPKKIKVPLQNKNIPLPIRNKRLPNQNNKNLKSLFVKNNNVNVPDTSLKIEISEKEFKRINKILNNLDNSKYINKLLNL